MNSVDSVQAVMGSDRMEQMMSMGSARQRIGGMSLNQLNRCYLLALHIHYTDLDCIPFKTRIIIGTLKHVSLASVQSRHETKIISHNCHPRILLNFHTESFLVLCADSFNFIKDTMEYIQVATSTTCTLPSKIISLNS